MGGVAENAKGKVEQAVGKATGHDSLRRKGEQDEREGIEDIKEDQAQRIGSGLTTEGEPENVSSRFSDPRPS